MTEIYIITNANETICHCFTHANALLVLGALRRDAYEHGDVREMELADTLTITPRPSNTIL